MTLRALWMQYASQLDSPQAKNPSHFLRSTEEELRNWSSILTLELRWQILEATAKLVLGLYKGWTDFVTTKKN